MSFIVSRKKELAICYSCYL